jgi:hypothetical protein
MLPYKMALKKTVNSPQTFVRSIALSSLIRYLLLMLALMTVNGLFAQQSTDDASDDASSTQDTPSANQANPSSATPSSKPAAKPYGTSDQSQWPGHIPLPAATPTSDSDPSLQVTPPSVTLPTPILPLLTNAPAEPTPTPAPDQPAVPLPTPVPVFNPPSAASLNLPSAQPAGNPSFAPASVGMPSMTLDDHSSAGPGALGGMFDWARKLRFQAAVRTGYDNNVNSAHGTSVLQVWNFNVASNSIVGTPIISSSFVNLNGGVNYRFGLPRFTLNLNLTGGLTRYLNSNIAQPTQGTGGLGLEIAYRFNPRMVFTFNSSSSYQQQPNIALVGTANSGNNAYYYTANSLAAAYQWSDLVTTVSTFSQSGSYYPGQTNQGFNNPSLTQSLRYLLRPTTTAVLDGTASYYGYGTSGNKSVGGVVDAGFDHIFNPKWFWNFRFGGQFQESQNSTSGNSSYFGPYLNSNFSWIFGRASSINWVTQYGTQPSGQRNTSFTINLSSGLNYSQGFFTKFTFNAGIFYLLTQYQNTPVSKPELATSVQVPVTGGGFVTVPGFNTVYVTSLASYAQASTQANISLSYTLNRILNLSLGYQFLTQNSPSAVYPSQAYNRGITYLQMSAMF